MRPLDYKVFFFWKSWSWQCFKDRNIWCILSKWTHLWCVCPLRWFQRRHGETLQHSYAGMRGRENIFTASKHAPFHHHPECCKGMLVPWTKTHNPSVRSFQIQYKVHFRNHMPWSSWIRFRDVDTFNICKLINIIQYLNWTKDKNHIIDQVL